MLMFSKFKMLLEDSLTNGVLSQKRLSIVLEIMKKVFPDKSELYSLLVTKTYPIKDDTENDKLLLNRKTLNVEELIPRFGKIEDIKDAFHWVSLQTGLSMEPEIPVAKLTPEKLSKVYVITDRLKELRAQYNEQESDENTYLQKENEETLDKMKKEWLTYNRKETLSDGFNSFIRGAINL